MCIAWEVRVRDTVDCDTGRSRWRQRLFVDWVQLEASRTLVSSDLLSWTASHCLLEDFLVLQVAVGAVVRPPWFCRFISVWKTGRVKSTKLGLPLSRRLGALEYFVKRRKLCFTLCVWSTIASFWRKNLRTKNPKSAYNFSPVYFFYIS